MAERGEYTDLVRRICCLRGIATSIGFGPTVEIRS